MKINPDASADSGSGVTVPGQYINEDGSVTPTIVTTYSGQRGLTHLPNVLEAYQLLSKSGSARERAVGIEGLAILQNCAIDNVTVSYVQALTSASDARRVLSRFKAGDICAITISGKDAVSHTVKLATTWTVEVASQELQLVNGEGQGAPHHADRPGPPPLRARPAEPHMSGVHAAVRPAVFFFHLLGDHLLTRPTILALQKYYQGSLGFIGAAEMAATFFPDANFRFSHVIPFVPAVDGEMPSFDPEAVAAVADEFDALIILCPWSSAPLEQLASIVRPKPIVALAGEYGVAPRGHGMHVVEYAFSVARFLDPAFRLDDFVSLPPVPLINRRRAEHILRLLPKDARILCVNTSTRPEKQWPRDRFRELLSRFLAQRTDYVALVVDDVDADLDRGELESRVFTLDGADLLTITMLVAKADLFLGIDSYCLHVADFAKVPSVGLFGPTDPAVWGCHFARHIHIGARQMSEISVDRVANALDQLLQEAQETREDAVT